MKVKAFWYTRKEWSPTRGNVGDMISPYLIERLSGEFPDYDKEGGGRFVAVGSLLEMIRDGDKVWGTGLLKGEIVRPQRNVTFYAVRGPLTRKVLIRSGYAKEAIPERFGDPCILTSYLFPKKRTLKYKIGVIPHYVDHATFETVFRGTGVHFINIMNAIDEFLEDINRCEVILSSSLHGIIISESYGINVIPIKLGDQLLGGAFKFDDYYRSTERSCSRIYLKKPVTMDYLDRLIRKYKFVSPNIEKGALLKACPFYQGGGQLL